jgi:hypothetical protein
MAGDDEITVYAIPREVKSAVEKYTKAVEKALIWWVKKNLEVFDGPMWDDGIKPREIVSTLMDEDAAYLYYMEAEGHGVGTWDGRWKHIASDRDLDTLSNHIKRATSREHGILYDAIFNAADAAVEEQNGENRSASKVAHRHLTAGKTAIKDSYKDYLQRHDTSGSSNSPLPEKAWGAFYAYYRHYAPGRITPAFFGDMAKIYLPMALKGEYPRSSWGAFLRPSFRDADLPGEEPSGDEASFLKDLIKKMQSLAKQDGRHLSLRPKVALRASAKKVAHRYLTAAKAPKRVEVEWDFGDTDLEDMPYRDALKESGLPKIVKLPKDLLDEWEAEDQDDSIIDDWLSDEYGFTHFGWKKRGSQSSIR